MGVDIYTGSGILFTIDDAVSVLFKGITASKIKKLIPEIESQIEDNEKEALKGISTLSDLAGWFCEYANSKINKESDYIEDSDKLVEILSTIIDYTKFAGKLPDISIEYFTSNRYSGWDVPVETVCVVLNDSSIFETKLTKRGQALAKLIGSKNVKQTTWTVYSY